MGWNCQELRERLSILVIMGTRTDANCFRSQIGMGSESHCLFGQLRNFFGNLDSKAGVKVEKSGGVIRGLVSCGDAMDDMLARARRR